MFSSNGKAIPNPRGVVTASLLVILAPLLLFGCNQSRQPVISQPAQELAGNWYMGTMTGQDCTLVFKADNTLSVQYGGCFHQDPWVRSPWSWDGERINIINPELHMKLGKFLAVSRYKSNLILVPQLEQATVAKEGFKLAHCFWKSTEARLVPVESDDFK